MLPTRYPHNPSSNPSTTGLRSHQKDQLETGSSFSSGSGSGSSFSSNSSSHIKSSTHYKDRAASDDFGLPGTDSPIYLNTEDLRGAEPANLGCMNKFCSKALKVAGMIFGGCLVGFGVAFAVSGAALFGVGVFVTAPVGGVAIAAGLSMMGFTVGKILIDSNAEANRSIHTIQYQHADLLTQLQRDQRIAITSSLEQFRREQVLPLETRTGRLEGNDIPDITELNEQLTQLNKALSSLRKKVGSTERGVTNLKRDFDERNAMIQKLQSTIDVLKESHQSEKSDSIGYISNSSQSKFSLQSPSSSGFSSLSSSPELPTGVNAWNTVQSPLQRLDMSALNSTSPGETGSDAPSIEPLSFTSSSTSTASSGSTSSASLL